MQRSDELVAELNTLLDNVKKLEAKSFQILPSKKNMGSHFDIAACRANINELCDYYAEIGDVIYDIAVIAEPQEQRDILSEALRYYKKAIDDLVTIREEPTYSLSRKYRDLKYILESAHSEHSDIGSDSNDKMDIPVEEPQMPTLQDSMTLSGSYETQMTLFTPAPSPAPAPAPAPAKVIPLRSRTVTYTKR